jgi:hypothetical protein
MPVEQQSSLAASIYKALGVTDGGADVLGPLAATLKENSRGARARVAIDLVRALNRGGKAGSLEQAVLDHASAADPVGYQHDKDWPYGTHILRLELVSDLRVQATAPTTDPSVAKDYARAAILLAVEEGFLFGPSILRNLLAQTELERLTAWPTAAFTEVRRILDEDHQATGNFIQELHKIHHQILKPPSGELTSDQLNSLPATVQAMGQQALNRPHLKWHLAHLLLILSSFARSKKQPHLLAQLKATAESLKAAHRDSKLNRWLDDSVKDDAARSSDIRLIKAADLRKIAKRRVR